MTGYLTPPRVEWRSLSGGPVRKQSVILSYLIRCLTWRHLWNRMYFSTLHANYFVNIGIHFAFQSLFEDYSM